MKGNEFKIRENLGRTVLASLIVVTVAFIFTQSLLSKKISGEESAAVSNWISKIIPTTTGLGKFIFDNVRKIAHFVEFGLLGFELSLYVILYSQNKIRSAAVSTLTAFFIAFLDETLQIFSSRGPAIADVWLDFFGAVTFSAICWTFYVVIKNIKGRKE